MTTAEVDNPARLKVLLGAIQITVISENTGDTAARG
jgi:hypothetical protein